MTFAVIFISLVVLTGISVSNADGDYIELESFDVGQCIEVSYTVPTNGRTTVNLVAADGTTVLHADYRRNWGRNPSTGQPWKNILALNSKIQGSWGSRQEVNDIETTSGMQLDFEICANEADFSIVLNHKDIATYAYCVPVTTVSKVEFARYEFDSVLRKLCVVYSKPNLCYVTG